MTAQASARTRALTWLSVGPALLGILLIQAAWILVVPPFRGLDEHDHAYKAAAVARGDWHTTHTASAEGWGEFVLIPDDIVTAARPVCEALPYTTPDNCQGARTDDSGMTTVASSAARYNPLFYFVAGSAARPFSGVEALYAMRIATALICAGLVAFAVGLTRRWARSPWPAVATLLSITPMVTYSMSMTAPNGVEVAAALAVWSALLGLARNASLPASSGFVVAATAAAVPLALVRGLGPLWLLLIVLTVLPLVGYAQVTRLLRRRTTLVGAAVIFGAVCTAAAWTLRSGVAGVAQTETNFSGSPFPDLPKQWVLWFFQSTAAFPARDELAHLSLYVVGFLAWWVLAAVAWRVALRHERWALVAVLVVATAVPVAVTVASYDALGNAWQGRYGYPYAMGFLLICGYALDRATQTSRWVTVRWPIWVAAGTVLPTTLIWFSPGVLRDQVRTSPLAGTDAWHQPSPLLVVVLTASGLALVAWALSGTGRSEPSPAAGPPRHRRTCCSGNVPGRRYCNARRGDAPPLTLAPVQITFEGELVRQHFNRFGRSPVVSVSR